MPSPTFEAQMVTKLQALLLGNPGATEIDVDGQRISYADCVERLKYFERRVAIQNGTRPRTGNVNLGNF